VHRKKFLLATSKVAEFELARRQILAAIGILEADDGYEDAILELRSIARDLEAAVQKIEELS
jgi:hypothetical protein